MSVNSEARREAFRAGLDAGPPPEGKWFTMPRHAGMQHIDTGEVLSYERIATSRQPGETPEATCERVHQNAGKYGDVLPVMAIEVRPRFELECEARALLGCGCCVMTRAQVDSACTAGQTPDEYFAGKGRRFVAFKSGRGYVLPCERDAWIFEVTQ